MLVPLDRRREWYRYHTLFQELLHAELQRREAELVADLHRRAAAWCEDNGVPEMAIYHAQQAGDADTVARLVARVGTPTYASGRHETLHRWLLWFDERGLVDRYPRWPCWARSSGRCSGGPPMPTGGPPPPKPRRPRGRWRPTAAR